MALILVATCFSILNCARSIPLGNGDVQNVHQAGRAPDPLFVYYSNYWAKQHNLPSRHDSQSYVPKIDGKPIQIPQDFIFGGSNLRQKTTKPPMYVWRFNPVRKHDLLNKGDHQLNEWLGQKIANPASGFITGNDLGAVESNAHAKESVYLKHPSNNKNSISAGYLNPAVDGMHVANYEHWNYDKYYHDGKVVDGKESNPHSSANKNYDDGKVVDGKESNPHSSANKNYNEGKKSPKGDSNKESKKSNYSDNLENKGSGKPEKTRNYTGNKKYNLNKPSKESANKNKDYEKSNKRPNKNSSKEIYGEGSSKSEKSSSSKKQSQTMEYPNKQKENSQKPKDRYVKKEGPIMKENELLPGRTKATLNHDPEDFDWEDCEEECGEWGECDDCDFDDCEDEWDDDCADSLDISRDVDQDEMKDKFMNSIDSKFRALVFNPMADSTEKFQSCKTPTNETGNCRYIQHCLLPNIIGAIGQFMDYVCVINDRFIGVCCPEFPITTIKVKWDEAALAPGNESDIAVKTPEECGTSSKTRIVGGSKANPDDYPWMAALLTMSKGQFFCGGSVINNRYILTAAHCTFGIPKNQILVRLGEYDFGTEDPEFPGEDYPVIEIKRHAQYSRRTLLHDIALLKLSRPIEMNNRVGTICFPKANEDFIGATAVLAGWGNTKGGGPSSEVLLEAALKVANNTACQKEHGLPVPETFICTMSEDKESGACNGDSGGPLMLLDEDSKIWKIIGLVSWGRRGCEPKFPTVYTRITEYLDWIQAHAT